MPEPVSLSATSAGAEWVFELGERINRLLVVEAAAREVVAARKSGLVGGLTFDGGDVLDRLGEALDG